MYVGCRLVPWFSIHEFRYVLSCLKSSDDVALRKALLFMRIWLSRMDYSKIPRAIICTYELLLARFQKSTQALAMAVMRFISLVSSEDQDRTRSGFAIPIYSLAANIGLPSWMSYLRNEIAHGPMPSEDSLEKAYDFAIYPVRSGLACLPFALLVILRCPSPQI
ncbi:LAS1-like protein [Echinococcus granulosus]|uniref:LAS1-like protein n=1 Tax=Echinococcus granulosus TaxID=6210 RepID=W6US28_ECHGR|nr:LAS1-like protein [Echinococcus granulosus]EUB64058.1 LAS1-like protein [Echinococcus granulosus]